MKKRVLKKINKKLKLGQKVSRRTIQRLRGNTGHKIQRMKKVQGLKKGKLINMRKRG